MSDQKNAGSWKPKTMIVLAMLFAVSGSMLSQEHSKLDNRVQPPLRPVALSLLDLAAKDGLPTDPLVDKLLEGVSKGAKDDQVIFATKRLLDHLQIARKTLGQVSDQELVAAASVLRAKAPIKTLSEVQRALPNRSLAAPFSVLGIMLQQGFPVKEAKQVVIDKSRKLDDKTLLVLGNWIERGIADGFLPRTALMNAERRLNGLSSAK